MKITSFDDQINGIKRDLNQDGLFNLFQKNIINTNNVNLNLYIVPRECEMRLDRVSYNIYGSPDFTEELMVLNDIINPLSIKEGQSIWFCSVDDLNNLYVKDETLNNNAQKQALIKSAQPNRDKQNLSNSDKNLPPTIRPNGLEQIKVSKDNKVQIMNTFQ